METNFDEFKQCSKEKIADSWQIEAEDSLITLTKNCCLSLNEEKIWISHLQKKKETHAKAVHAEGKRNKSKEETKVISTETNIVNTHIFFKQFKFLLKTTQN